KRTSAPRATRGCAGCNRFCIARITLPAPANNNTCAARKRRKSPTSTATQLIVQMKPTRKSQPDLLPLLAFGAHPDDIEFACGGVIAKEISWGRPANLVICSRGEAGSHGTPKERMAEAKKSAKLLGSSVEFIQLDGDAHLEIKSAHAIKLARIVRRVKPGI